MTLIVDLLADNETLWKILPIESQNSAAGDWGTLGKTIETFLLGVELADFFSFNFEAKLLDEVAGTTGVFGAEFIVAVVVAIASSCWKNVSKFCKNTKKSIY